MLLWLIFNFSIRTRWLISIIVPFIHVSYAILNDFIFGEFSTHYKLLSELYCSLLYILHRIISVVSLHLLSLQTESIGTRDEEVYRFIWQREVYEFHFEFCLMAYLKWCFFDDRSVTTDKTTSEWSFYWINSKVFYTKLL